MASIKAAAPSVNSWNSDYLEEQYRRWKSDPGSTPPDLALFFQGFDLAHAAGSRPVNGVAPAPVSQAPAAEPRAAASVAVAPAATSGATSTISSGAPAAPVTGVRAGQMAVANLIRAYRELGHLAAALDPFGRERPMPDALTPQHHGLSEADLDAKFDSGDVPLPSPTPLRAIIELLDQTYCRSIGVEFGHILDVEERAWIIERLEGTRNIPNLSRGERVHVLYQLHRAEMFETFLHKRYIGQKRFSLEGGESLIPLLDRAIERGADTGVEEVVLGMAHRGRLNVLNNILNKTYEQIFTEFEHNWREDFVDGGGDVKYHLGYSGDRTLRTGKTVHLILASNPSHLEAVDGVVLGRARAKQRLRSDAERDRVAPLLVHGDAAFIGQGVVQETLNYSQLEGYTSGGTVHVIVNNLIGFTTGPEDARSSRYCTDVAKMIDALVLHVNGEDPEAVVQCAAVAMEYRQRFNKDVVIDMWCVRKWGHNEGDDPSFTQPVMARLIQQKPSVLRSYAERLLREGVITEADVEQIRKDLDDQMERAQSEASKKPHDPTIDPGGWRWKGMGRTFSFDPVETGVPRETLQEIAAGFGRWPKGFQVHKNLAKILTKRAECVEKDEPIDWGTGELLAFGSLVLDGKPVRLSGQDARRGTFSQRHAVIRDVETGTPYCQLNAMREVGSFGAPGREPGTIGADGKARQAEFSVYDSPLSEYGVLAFEYGFSLADPDMLVLWEAQFGDFSNGAQVVVDQFLASAEAKWQRWSGLVLLLPHGYEGQGPEHSSARMERYLQLCADNNMQVCYPTTPAQHFHALRRQLKRPFRKPLVVMTPKSLLRLPEATSSVDDFVSRRFQEVMDDPVFEQGERERRRVKRVVLCTGKVYYDLVRQREGGGAPVEDVAIVRLEQLYPFHAELVRSILAKYPDSAEKVWVQEEPKNMGAYWHVVARTVEQLGWQPPAYIGRPSSATPATGSKEQHDEEQQRLLDAAIPRAAKPAVAAAH